MTPDTLTKIIEEILARWHEALVALGESDPPSVVREEKANPDKLNLGPSELYYELVGTRYRSIPWCLVPKLAYTSVVQFVTQHKPIDAPDPATRILLCLARFEGIPILLELARHLGHQVWKIERLGWRIIHHELLDLYSHLGRQWDIMSPHYVVLAWPEGTEGRVDVVHTHWVHGHSSYAQAWSKQLRKVDIPHVLVSPRKIYASVYPQDRIATPGMLEVANRMLPWVSPW